jgi:hypothetical protein
VITRKTSAPPRPIVAGDVVASFSEALGEWAAAQVTDLDVGWNTAGVLELDWSGPEPVSMAELGDVAPLRHAEGMVHVNRQWVLPRSLKVIGSLPLLTEERSRSYSLSPEWPLGDVLAYQRRRAHGVRDTWSIRRETKYTGAELDRAFSEPRRPDRETHRLHLSDIEVLDCDQLVDQYPDLRQLLMWGDLGTLRNAASLNRLTSLRHLFIKDLFGMGRADCLLPECVTKVESVRLYSIPAEYAAAMRAHWRAEIPNGTYVDISGARKLEWVAQNKANPMREWADREHISSARYKKAVNQYRKTRKAVMATLSQEPTQDQHQRLFELGHEYGQAFNTLDGRRPFIETVEREDLFDALDLIVSDAEVSLGRDLTSARDSLKGVLDAVRDW